jgi:hypothetical protein
MPKVIQYVEPKLTDSETAVLLREALVLMNKDKKRDPYDCFSDVIEQNFGYVLGEGQYDLDEFIPDTYPSFMCEYTMQEMNDLYNYFKHKGDGLTSKDIVLVLKDALNLYNEYQNYHVYNRITKSLRLLLRKSFLRVLGLRIGVEDVFKLIPFIHKSNFEEISYISDEVTHWTEQMNMSETRGVLKRLIFYYESVTVKQYNLDFEKYRLL